MKYLLDINALIALAHTAHVHHGVMLGWYRQILPLASGLHTCSITELGFVRVAVQASLQPDVPTAKVALARLKASSKIPFSLLVDKGGAADLPPSVRKPTQVTDGHLLNLAASHHVKLATLDKGIPGAFLITS